MAREVSGIAKWKPKESEIYVSSDNKIFVVEFDKIFGKPKYGVYNRFIIRKESYENQLDVMCKYINYFINFYDTHEELVNAYLKIKFALDSKTSHEM